VIVPQLINQKDAVEYDGCAVCGGVLAIIADDVVDLTNTAVGVQVIRDNRGRVIEDQLERDEAGKLTPRARRRSYVGCGQCRRPVPRNHQRQLKIDADWDQIEAKEREECSRVLNAVPAVVKPYEQLNPVHCVEERMNAAEKRLAALEKRLDAAEIENTSLRQQLQGRRPKG